MWPPKPETVTYLQVRQTSWKQRRQTEESIIASAETLVFLNDIDNDRQPN